MNPTPTPQQNRQFIRELRESHQVVLLVAEWLRGQKYQVTLVPNEERPSFEERMDYSDDCDLMLNMPIEVKQTKLANFPNGEKDWPFPMVNVMATHSWKKKSPKPLFVLVVSKDKKNAVLIHKDTEKHWVEARQTDRRDGRSQGVLKCPKEHCKWLTL